MLLLLLRARRGSNAQRRGPDAVCWAPQRCADVVPGHERPRRGLGADTGGLAHWSQPGGGTSSGTSTTTALGLPATAGADEVGGAATATPMVASMTDAACYGSTIAARCRGSATVAACCTYAATRSGSEVIAAGCGSVTSAAPRESPLPTAAVLAAARDALDERRLVGTAASDLSTLTDARGALWAPPCEHEGEKVRP
jgi:hypothetical protein